MWWSRGELGGRPPTAAERGAGGLLPAAGGRPGSARRSGGPRGRRSRSIVDGGVEPPARASMTMRFSGRSARSHSVSTGPTAPSSGHRQRPFVLRPSVRRQARPRRVDRRTGFCAGIREPWWAPAGCRPCHTGTRCVRSRRDYVRRRGRPWERGQWRPHEGGRVHDVALAVSLVSMRSSKGAGGQEPW